MAKIRLLVKRYRAKSLQNCIFKRHISGDWVIYQIVEDPRLTKLLSKSLEILFSKQI